MRSSAEHGWAALARTSDSSDHRYWGAADPRVRAMDPEQAGAIGSLEPRSGRGAADGAGGLCFTNPLKVVVRHSHVLFTPLQLMLGHCFPPGRIRKIRHDDIAPPIDTGVLPRDFPNNMGRIAASIS
jgi:hypothetical protein